MITLQQDARHPHSAHLFRSRVVRTIQKPVHEGVLGCGLVVTQYAGQQPHYCINHRHRGNLTAGQDEVA